jgi:hypothetical protein
MTDKEDIGASLFSRTLDVMENDPLEEIFADWESYGKEEHPNIEAPIEIYESWIDIDEAIKGE